MSSERPWCNGCEVYPVSEFLRDVESELPPTVREEVITARALINRQPCPRVMDLRDEPERPFHCDYPLESEAKIAFRGALHVLVMQRNGSEEPPNIAPLVEAARAR